MQALKASLPRVLGSCGVSFSETLTSPVFRLRCQACSGFAAKHVQALLPKGFFAPANIAVEQRDSDDELFENDDTEDTWTVGTSGSESDYSDEASSEPE